MYQLVRLEHKIQSGLKRKKVVLVAYFDIEKAFDRVPQTAILAKLARAEISGKLLALLKTLLGDRVYQVFIQGELSAERL